MRVKVNNESNENRMTGGEEAEFRRVVALATRPEPAEGAIARLMARIEAEPVDNVVLFRPRNAVYGSRLPYAAALPLAASLALGIYLGAMGSLDFVLPSAITGGTNLTLDSGDDLGGVGEAEQFAEENLT